MPEATDPPDPSGALAPAEKAKMDYQAQLDRKKVEIGGARWREIVWDKAIFAAGIVLFGALATLPVNCWLERNRQAQTAELERARADEARALERFRQDEARFRFLAEKRLDAVLANAAAMSKVTAVFFAYTKEKKDAPPAEADQKLGAALDDAREVINRTAPLFPQEFNEDTDRYYEVLRAIRTVGVAKCSDYRGFVAQLSTEYDQLGQAVIVRRDADPAPLPRLSLAAIGFDGRDAAAAGVYLTRHLVHWQALKKKSP